MVKRNRARCLECNDIIESKYTHDFVTCKCGALSVDGGLSYAKRCFKEHGRWVNIADDGTDLPEEFIK